MNAFTIQTTQWARGFAVNGTLHGPLIILGTKQILPVSNFALLIGSKD